MTLLRNLVGRGCKNAVFQQIVECAINQFRVVTSIENSFAGSEKIKQNDVKLGMFLPYIISYKESICTCNIIMNFKISWKALEGIGF